MQYVNLIAIITVCKVSGELHVRPPTQTPIHSFKVSTRRRSNYLIRRLVPSQRRCSGACLFGKISQ